MELKNRNKEEKKLAKALREISDKHREELIRLLGTPPDIDNVPDSFWAKIEQEVKDELAGALAVIMLLSSKQHGFIGDRIRNLSDSWAKSHSDGLTKKYAQHTKDMTKVALRDLSDKEDVSKNDIDDRLKTVLGQSRADNIARTETTSATSAGSELSADERKPLEVKKTAKEKGKKITVPDESIREGGVVEVPEETEESELKRFNDAMDKIPVGKSLADTWFTSEMNNVCPICQPLHGANRSKWSAKFPKGPPAHPSCNCWIDYERDRKIEDLKAEFDIK